MLLGKLGRLIRSEAVLFIAAACAILSMFAVPPNKGYSNYIDFRVIAVLFCLMAVVTGFQECGLFRLLAQKMLAGKHRLSSVNLTLVLLPFFTSMFITNDVALITFVPFAILVLKTLGRRSEIIRIVVLQTVAANLGSMATPVGNPQNLFLFAYYNLSASEFFGVIAPITAVSLAALMPAVVFGANETVEVLFDKEEKVERPRMFTLCVVLFALCILSVFRVLDYKILTAVVVLSFMYSEYKLLLRVDYGLLLTFICFFVFSGNLGAMPYIEHVLRGVMTKNALIASAAASQVISNVPAAVLLAPLTEPWKGLLLGVDIGGLGTPVASLASLISLKLYMKTDGACPVRYMLVFATVNVIGLIILLPFAAMWT